MNIEYSFVVCLLIVQQAFLLRSASFYPSSIFGSCANGHRVTTLFYPYMFTSF